MPRQDERTRSVLHTVYSKTPAVQSAGNIGERKPPQRRVPWSVSLVRSPTRSPRAAPPGRRERAREGPKFGLNGAHATACVRRAQPWWKWLGSSGTDDSSLRGDCCLGRFEGRLRHLRALTRLAKAASDSVSRNLPAIMMLHDQHARPRGRASRHGQGRGRPGSAG